MFACSTDKYQAVARFQAAHGPVTSLALSHDGTFLASGGRNQFVQIWDVQDGKLFCTLSDRLGRWGQITCMKWLEGIMQARSHILCFGTGRGYLVFYEKVKDSDTFRELTCRAIFPFNDPVKAIDYNGNKERLVASSHAGKLGMYSVAKQATFLETIWTKRLSESVNGKETIPRAVHFISNDSFIVCGLETGTIFSKASSTGSDSWNQQIRSSIGEACLSPNSNMILIDNVIDGFDIYSFPALEHIDFLEIPRAEPYYHGGTFIEGSNSVACGSDHGQVYLFSTKTSKCFEKLRIGSKKSRIQAIDGFSDERHHLISAATSDETPEIIIWRKLRIKTVRNRASTSSLSLKTIFLLNIIVLIAALAIFFPSRLRQESTLDKLVSLRRETEDATFEEVRAWEIIKAKAARAKAESEAKAKAEAEAEAEAKAEARVKAKVNAEAKAKAKAEAKAKANAQAKAKVNTQAAKAKVNAEAKAEAKAKAERGYGVDLTRQQGAEVEASGEENARLMDNPNWSRFGEVGTENLEQGQQDERRNDPSEKHDMGTGRNDEFDGQREEASGSGEYLEQLDGEDVQED